MSHPPLLPQTVRIKRKRQDEPVDTLHVHTQDDSLKRRRHTASSSGSKHQQQQHQQQSQPAAARQAQAVFRRVHEAQDRISETAATGTGTAAAANAGAAGVKGQPSTLSNTRPCPSSSSSSAAAAASPGFPTGDSRSAIGHGHGGGGSTGGSSTGRRILTPGPQATRRFHLARSSHHQHSSSSGASSTTGPAGGVKKRKNVATLVESKPKKGRSGEPLNPALTEYVSQRLEEQNNGGLAEPPLKRPGKSSAVSTPRKASSALTSTTVSTNTPTTASSDAATTLQHQATAHANTNAAAAALNAANAVDPALLADMQRFAHEVEVAEQLPSASKLTTNNAFAPGSAPGTPSRPTPQKLKFQPKATPRYRARHPVLEPPTAALGAMDIDGQPKAASSASYTSSSESSSNSDSDEDDDDGDYVYDTYIRYDGPADVLLHDPMSSAATAATAAAVPALPLPPSVGLLVIAADDQPLWEAYADADPDVAEDEDGEFDTDDEDSNAEDWRGNEYPEEEDGDSDDSDGGVGGKMWARGKRGNVIAVEDEEWDARGLGADSDSEGDDPWGEKGDAAAWSDDDEEARMRRPFAVPGWLRR
ncbi:hypothetical protein HDK90DRAFT_231728 [Phyllosticta capitalensis]|uniref:Transcription factor Iwr1 domain-containing protein n=1 Tax=Phyllosticta capitalensis TaxID=121624 RepID=A0ABR1YVA9_9PEZI